MSSNIEYLDDGKFDEDTLTNRLNKKNKSGGMKRRYYPSNIPQTLICNAATGVLYPYRVGTHEQSLLYKIVDATGTCDGNGFLIKKRKHRGAKTDDEEEEQSELPNPNTNHLFFDSPEQCMAHMRVVISPTDVARWHDGARCHEGARPATV
jgi:hypothetical protein